VRAFYRALSYFRDTQTYRNSDKQQAGNAPLVNTEIQLHNSLATLPPSKEVYIMIMFVCVANVSQQH